MFVYYPTTPVYGLALALKRCTWRFLTNKVVRICECLRLVFIIHGLMAASELFENAEAGN
jgi:hypothetical protein